MKSAISHTTPVKKPLRLTPRTYVPQPNNTRSFNTPSLSNNHRRASLPNLANELLGEIADELLEDFHAFTSFMLTCRRTAVVAEAKRYTSVTVWGPIGRRLLGMLLSNSVTAERYCHMIKRLRFIGRKDTQMYLNMSLLGDVLPLLVNLRTLRIDAEDIRSNTDDFLGILREAGVKRKSEHPALALSALWKSEAAVSLMTLPELRYLYLTGESSLWQLGSYRGLRELEIRSILNIETFAEFLMSAEGSVLGRSLEILHIKLSRTIDLELGLPFLSSTFGALQSLCLDRPGSTLEDVLPPFGVKEPLFPALRRLLVNPRLAYLMGTRKAKQAMLPAKFAEVERLLLDIQSNHGQLYAVGLGRWRWERDFTGRFHRSSDDKVQSVPFTGWWARFFGEQNNFPVNKAYPYQPGYLVIQNRM